MFVSAGNMREEICEKKFVYHDWNMERGGVEDPGQAWNAISVGAFTEKIEIRNKTLAGYEPLAPTGGLCPTSRTSLAWPEKRRDGWPIKPDLVLEGGNYAMKDGPPLSCDDLSLLSTIMKPGRLLTTMLDTSPATALAARMAATIWSHHPDFWPETVRALMVHTARWSAVMKEKIPASSKSDILKRLRCYGYGVPNLQRALHSAQNAVTMIYQGEFQPFRMERSEVRTNHMNVHDLPWPVEALENLGEEKVTMRVTLSYFVEPSPGNVGWGVNHRYASHGLRFDVIRPTESLLGFMQRLSRAFWDSPTDRPTNAKDTRDWVVGEDGRCLGSLHSDWWKGSAATLARSSKLLVYPVSGWWKERKHLERYNQSARYSLIISIRSAKKEIDLYNQILNAGAIQTEVFE
jgi:Subtilase family